MWENERSVHIYESQQEPHETASNLEVQNFGSMKFLL